LTYLLFIAVAAIVLVQRGLLQAVQLNFLAKDTASFMFNDSSSYSNHPISTITIDNCRASWYQGLLERWQGNMKAAAESWQISMPCDLVTIPMLETLFPEDSELAARAVQHYPDHAPGWFWLAKTVSPSVPEQAIEFYRRGLTLSPSDGIRWRELGDLLRIEDPHEAIEAYLQSCFYGDPGSNGCVRAGLVAEQLGELENAILYYSYSHWDKSLQRAEELRATLEDSAQP
jgi:tetratricopeptide (TPR) repeat protein